MKFIKKLRLNILFIILAIVIILFDDVKSFLIYALVIAIHELAHYIVAKKLGYNLNKFYIMPYGVCLNYQENIFSGNDELLIAMAGPLVNYILCMFCVALWWLFPETYYFLDYFCFCNLLLAVFNTLPCFPLDGGRVLTCLLSKSIDREKAYKITLLLNLIFCALLTILFVISIFISINFTYLFVAIFLFSGIINPQKYSSFTYLSLSLNRSRVYEKGCNVKVFAVSAKMAIYKIIAKFSRYKYNVIYVIFDDGAVKVLSEKSIYSLALKYSPAYSIYDIVNFCRP